MRSYDDVSYTDPSYPATVSDFWLDRYEVTVGRFRKFVQAWDGGWRPQRGAGKHLHLSNGDGVAGETGWDPTGPSTCRPPPSRAGLLA